MKIKIIITKINNNTKNYAFNRNGGDFMDKIENKYSNSIFENIKHVDQYRNEYWYARELQKVLEYKDW